MKISKIKIKRKARNKKKSKPQTSTCALNISDTRFLSILENSLSNPYNMIQ